MSRPAGSGAPFRIIFRERLRVSKASLAALGAHAALTRAARSLLSWQLPERRHKCACVTDQAGLALLFVPEKPLDHLELRSLFFDLGIRKSIDGEFCADVELLRTPITLPCSVELGVSRSGTLQAFKYDWRRRAQIAKRLHSEVGSNVPTGVERGIRGFKDLGVSATETRVGRHS
jgi:hypothetical protein